MMKNLLEDVNLDAVEIGADGTSVILRFIDMHKGRPINAIKCLSVHMFNYQNVFDASDGFACYVGEVKYVRIEKKDVSAWLSKNNFTFTGVNGGITPQIGEGLIWLHLEGGEIMIDIACQHIELDKDIFG